MEGKSVWLGRFRKPVRLLMILFTAASLLLYVWLVVNRLLDPEAIAMFEMIRPGGRPMVQLTLFCLFGAILFASLYLSDFRGDIEPPNDGIFDIVSLVLSRAAMISIALIVLVMFYEVVSRYVFSAPTLWANELSLWIAAFVFLLSGQYAMQQRCHIRIPVIYDRMPRWMRKLSDSLSVLFIVGFVFALVWGGYTDAENRFLRMETFGTAWDPPIPGIIKPVLLLSMVLVAIQAVSNLIADWSKENVYDSPDAIDDTEIEIIRRSLENK
ncbi:TRAP transporter small permease [Maribius pontilimi]|uniref:TRAP transporter small permease protein n=1 Tax=Palleronia pontilimi TaxID=1964209 RepID=A0A934IGP9_9RHOB|nr:TRAP transporter small permease [Palleronia pontilimi]MBJ3764062.1 TRAP transporter small permease [Palleronia pontilimi]